MLKRIAAVMLFAGSVFGFPVSTNTFYFDVTEPEKVTFRVPQGETRVMKFILDQDGTELDVSALTAQFMYKANTMTNWAYIDGTTTSNIALVSWGPDYDPGYMRYDSWLRFADGSGNTAFRIQVDMAMMATPAFDPDPISLDTNVPLDWTEFSGYEYTSTAGPVRPDFVSIGAVTNADGSITISSLDDLQAVLNRGSTATNFITVYGLQLDTTYSNGVSEGRIQWNSQDGTYEGGLAGGRVVLQFGQEMVFRGYNASGSVITNGTPIAIVSLPGQRTAIVPWDPNAQAPTNILDGVATEDIPITGNRMGFYCTAGRVRELDTRGYNEGQRVYATKYGWTSNLVVNPIAMGTVEVVDETDGVILVAFREFGNSNVDVEFLSVNSVGDVTTDSGASLTNAQALADTALQPADTNGWTVSTHSTLVPYSGATNFVNLGSQPFSAGATTTTTFRATGDVTLGGNVSLYADNKTISLQKNGSGEHIMLQNLLTPYGNVVGSKLVSSGSYGQTMILDLDASAQSNFENFSIRYNGTDTKFVLDRYGNVGIGTNTPSYKLDVNGALRTTGAATFDSTVDSAGRVRIGNNATIGNALLSPYPSGGLILKPEFNISDTSVDVLSVRKNDDTNIMSIKESGKVGIGTSSPEALLHVLGTYGTYLDGLSLVFQRNGISYISSTNASSAIVIRTGGAATANDRIYVGSTGNVGIGTNAPSYKLDVNGTMRTTGAATFDSTVNAASVAATGSVSGNNVTIGSSAPTVNFTDGTAGDDDYRLMVNSDDFQLQQYVGDATYTPRLFVDGGTGNVGICTNAPSYKLDVNGTLRTTGAATFDSTLGVTGLSSLGPVSAGATTTTTFRATGDATLDGSLFFDGNTYLDGLASDTIAFRVGGNLMLELIENGTTDRCTFNGNSIDIDTIWNALGKEAMRVDGSTGNVGIGTNSPASKLDVNGASTFRGIINTDNNWISGDGEAEGIYVADNGNVGIGTNVPAYKLDVNGTFRATGAVTIGGALNSSGSISTTAGIGGQSMNVASSVPGYTWTAATAGHDDWRALAYEDNLYFQQYVGDATWTERFRFDVNGNVGIGTNAPSYKLDVNGTLRATGAATFDSTASFGGSVILPNATYYRAYTAAGGARDLLGLNALNDLLVGTTSGSDLRNINLSTGTGYLTFNSGTEKFRITSTGDVGIGTNSPATKLDVNGASTFRGDVSLSGYSASNVGTITVTNRILYPSISAPANPAISFGDGDTGFYEVSDDTIGITQDGIKWQWSGNYLWSIDASAAWIRQNAGSSSAPVYSFNGDTDTGLNRVNANSVALTAGGVDCLVATNSNIGIGTSSPSTKLHVVGGAQANYFTATDGLCEADFKDAATQAFTGAGGFQVVTNFEVNVAHSSFTATHSNLTVGVTGLYRVYMALSYSAGGASEVACHLYTNNVSATTASGNTIGWSRTTSSVGQDGVVACEKLLNLSAGTTVDWRIDVGADETLTWNHGTVGIERK